MKKTRHVKGPGQTKLNLKQVLKLVGQELFMRHTDNEDLFYKVIVKSIDPKKCGLKVTVEPVAGIGELETCLLSLYDFDQVNEIIAREEVLAQIEAEVDEITELRYYADQKAAFILLAKKLLSEEDYAKFEEEFPYGLKRIDKHEIEHRARQLITEKYKNRLTLSDEDDE